MEQLHCTGQNIAENILNILAGLYVVLVLQTGLCNLNIPVAEDIPDKVVQLLCGNTQLILVDIGRDILHQRVVLRQNPLVLHSQLFRKLNLVNGQIHLDKAGCIPDLIAEVAACLDTCLRIAHIISGRVAGCKREAQCIRTVLLNDLQRVNAVAQRFGHLASLLIADQTVNINRLERNFLHVLHAGEDHAGNPEEDDVISGDQRVRRIEVLQLLGLVRPSKRGERPQRGREPGVQNVFFLMDVGAAALRADRDVFLGDRHLTAVVAIVCRNLMTPPQLTGDAPVV